ncbi:MAG: S8 family serine peptidase [Chromatiaceae bacterium]|nr:S8 family serine peptidase [Chromatiaceae bacterium]MCF7993333.1 S8 family serine peptidase [Chromatiaceae bacterium]MCF8014847.1 S8 family serine peptidase [Chromatiaceae bacterium]
MPTFSAIRPLFLPLLMVLASGLLTPGATASPSRPTIAPAVYETVDKEGAALVVVALKRPPLAKRATPMKRAAAIAQAQTSMLGALDTRGYAIRHRYRSVFAIALTVNSRTVLEQLESDPQVRRVDLDVGGSGGLDQSRPWVGADQAHATGITGNGTMIAVLDTGIDTNHPALVDDLAREHCICNTGTDCCPSGGSLGDGPGSAEDDNGHGTHVSGIVTGSGSGAPLGIAPDAQIIAVKVMSLRTSTRFSGDCDDETAWTMAWADAIDALRAVGTLSIASSGNDDDKANLSAPACLSGAVAVGATFDNQDAVMPLPISRPHAALSLQREHKIRDPL